MGIWVLDVDVYCASYSDIAARERYTVGSMRAVSGVRSVMEKRIPLLGMMVSGNLVYNFQPTPFAENNQQ
jgi:hypothetical protein